MITGIQISSLKPLLLNKRQVSDTFSKVRALDCQTVQLQWIDASVSIEDIAASLHQNDIQSVSVQDFYEVVRQNFSYYTQLNSATGGRWLCVSRIPDRLKSPQGLNTFIIELQEMQKRLDPIGQVLCFHPVSADFQAIPGINAVEYLFDHMPELNICLDLYHLNQNCGDMPGFIRKYANRICMVHFKDSSGDTLVPAGQGDTDWTGVVSACLDANVPYAFVEQEQWTRDPFDCLKEAMEWLNLEIARK